MNVYYLPARTSMAPEPIAAAWPSLPVRLRNVWWRLRLAMVEVRGLLRSRPQYELGVAYEPLFEDEPMPVPRPARPARLIDFEEARRRLRPRPAPER